MDSQSGYTGGVPLLSQRMPWQVLTHLAGALYLCGLRFGWMRGHQVA